MRRGIRRLGGAGALLLIAFVSACGFHLRGREAVQLPPQLAHLRVAMSDRMAFPPLLVEMRNALHAQAGVVIEPATAAVPTLNLLGEATLEEPELLVDVVTNTVRTSGYILSYKVRFDLKDAAGRDLLPLQTVRVQRQFDFDPTNVLAKEKERDFLTAEMQRDAIQQILRRLATAKLATPVDVPANPAPAAPTSAAPPHADR